MAFLCSAYAEREAGKLKIAVNGSISTILMFCEGEGQANVAGRSTASARARELFLANGVKMEKK